MPSDMQRNKQAVAQSFSRAAGSYDSVAQLQRDIGMELLTVLPQGLQPEVVVDVGSGTGFFTQKLCLRYPKAQLIGLDFAEGMLQHARAQQSSPLTWIGADMEALPFACASVDLLFSSLAVQWSENLPVLCAEFFRALKPGGYVALATLGPQTLFELRDSWSRVDGFTHVNQFSDALSLRKAAQQNGLVECAWRRGEKIMHYGVLRELTHELKALGAHNVNRERAPGLTGRQKLKALREAYEQYRTPAGLPASYEVYWLLLQKPE